jgi:hypothetical protein
MPRNHRGFRYVLLVLVVFWGCSRNATEDGTVRVRGRVTNAGQPLEVEGTDVGLGSVAVGFYPMYDGEELVELTSAQANAEGHFELIDGIPPGTYRITVRQWDPYPQVDRLKGKFDEKRSKIVRQLTGEEDLVIDVSKPEG